MTEFVCVCPRLNFDGQFQSNFQKKLLWRRKREAPPPDREAQVKLGSKLNADVSVSISKCYRLIDV